MKNPSSNHKNNKPHNWIVYKIIDHFLLKYAPLYKGVLYDLGCGNTEYKDFFLSYADAYVGVDWSNSPHDLKAEVFADLNMPLPIDSEVADTIVSISVLEHLYNPQLMLEEAFRIMKPDGNLILQVPWQWRIHEAPHDYFRYSPYALKHMLEKAGFNAIEVVPTSGFFTTWLVKFNYFTQRLINSQVRIVRGVMKTIFIPIWYINQIIAPQLDKLDKNWLSESQGYFVTAKKVKL